MRPTLLPVVAVLAASAITFAWVGVPAWDNAKTGLLTALSVIAAATLVRLARGFPFSNPDHFEPDEVEKVVEAVKKTARALRALLGITLGVMVALVLAQPISLAIADAPLPLIMVDLFHRCLSAALGAGCAFILARMWQVVGSDLSLLDRQGMFTIRAVRRKQRKADEDREKQSDIPPFRTPKDYGKRIQ